MMVFMTGLGVAGVFRRKIPFTMVSCPPIVDPFEMYCFIVVK